LIADHGFKAGARFAAAGRPDQQNQERTDMYKTTQHLNDEHMRLYEWCGAGAVMPLAIPAKSKRTHSWHASYDVLALMTSLLILNGCENKGPAK